MNKLKSIFLDIVQETMNKSPNANLGDICRWSVNTFVYRTLELDDYYIDDIDEVKYYISRHSTRY